MKAQPRRARIALISAFGAFVLAARLYGFYTDESGIDGVVAVIAMYVLIVGGAVALYVGLSSLDWKQVRRNRKKRRRR